MNTILKRLRRPSDRSLGLGVHLLLSLFCLLICQVAYSQQCDYTDQDPITFTATGGSQGAAFTTVYIITNAQDVILGSTTSSSFGPRSAGSYLVYGVTYETSSGISGITVGGALSQIMGPCFDISLPLEVTVCSSCTDYEVEIDGSTVICLGDETTLTTTTTSATTSYVWSTGDQGSSITVAPSSTTTYTVQSTSATGCIAEDMITIFVNQPPPLSLAFDDDVCAGDMVTIQATTHPSATILWSNGLTGDLITVTADQSLTLEAVATLNGCSTTEQASIVANGLPDVSISASTTTACPGASVTLTASATIPASFEWSTGEVGPSITVTPQSTTSYSVQAVTAAACAASESITVSLDPTCDLCAIYDCTQALSECGYCLGLPIGITTAGGNSTLTTVYAITDRDGIITGITPLTQFNPQSVGLGFVFPINYDPTAGVSGLMVGAYILDIQGGCIDIGDPFIYNVCPSPDASIVTSTGSITVCSGDALTLSVPALAGQTYSWSTGATTSSIQVSPATTQSYTVEVTSDGGCTDTDVIVIEAAATPIFDISSSLGTALCVGDEATLSVDLQAGESILWSTGETTPDIIVTPSQPSTTYSATVTSTDGCTADSSIEITTDASCGLCLTFDCSDAETCSYCEGDEVTFVIDDVGNASLTTVYIVTDSYGVIADISTDDNLGVQPPGLYFVFPINYDSTLPISGLQIGHLISDIQSSCAEIGEPVIYRVCALPAAAITSSDPDSTICDSETVTLTITTSADNTILWSTGATTPTIDVAPASTKTYTAVVTTPRGCTTTLSQTIEVGPCSGEIITTVWEDLNGNGLLDQGEPTIPGLEVTLVDDQGDEIATLSSDNQGEVAFTDLVPGDYTLVYDLPEDFEVTFADVGLDDEVDSDISSTTLSSPTITLGPGQVIDDVDAGFYEPIPIGQFVWYDIDLDNVRDFTENGINGMQVNLFGLVDGSFVLVDTDVTSLQPGTPSTDGYFKFLAPPGTYYVSIDLPPYGLVPAIKDALGFLPLNAVGGEQFTDSDLDRNGRTDTFVVRSGDEVCSIGAGYYPQATVGNSVWLDNNNNGRQDSAEPKVQNVLVEVVDAVSDQVVDMDRTDASGIYAVDQLQATSYYLRFSPPAQYSFTQPFATVADKDSDVDNSQGFGTTPIVSLQSGQVHTGIDAGLVAGVLPIEMGDLTATRVDHKHNLLRWSTFVEIQSSHFEIERRLDDRWQYIGRVSAHGYSDDIVHYHYSDEDSSDPGMYHYRLRLVDIDGSYAYSDVVSLQVKDALGVDLRYYPNPTSSLLHLTYTTRQEGSVVVEISDMSGAIVDRLELASDRAAGIQDDVIDLSPYQSGSYTLTLVLPSQTRQITIIKI